MKSANIINQVIIFCVSLFLLYYMAVCIISGYKEGFSVNDIDNMFDDVKQVSKVVSDIPDSINNINKKLTQQVDDASNKIEKKATDMNDKIWKKTEEIGNDLEKKATNMGDKILKKTEEMGNSIEKKTEEMGKEIEKKTEQMGKEIEKKTVVFVTEKLKSVFTQLGDIFNKGLVMPILALFTGIGNIFVQVFDIMKEFSNKIVSLPSCVFIYAIKETIDTYFFLYNKIFPRFLRNIFSFLYRYLFNFIFDFIGYITGYDNSVRKCYGFNVSSQVDNINNNLNNIQSTFKKDFGRMDFTKINI